MLREVTHKVSTALTHWLSIAVVVLLMQCLLDPLFPGAGVANATRQTALLNILLSLAVGLSFCALMKFISNKTRKPQVVSMTESTKILNSLLEQAKNK